MNQALSFIGCRNPSLRKAATAAAKRIGTVEIDHGDTDCHTPDAAAYMLRWISTRGEVGPWSEVATGTVAA